MSINKIVKLNFPRWLIISICLYIVILFSACLTKYYFHLYNSLDLAIFNHVLWNSLNGDWFFSSINPPSYFGDHLAPLLILILPLYRLFPSPVLLLFLQTLILALTAWPLYLIAKQYLQGHWLKIIVGFWLLNPFVHSANLFEFHLISIFPFLFFWLWYFFIKNRFISFAVTLSITLILREDAALALMGMASLFILYKKLNKNFLPYFITTIFLSLAWFFIANKLVALFNTAGVYKFLDYYRWLGDSLGDIALNIAAHPWLIAKQMLAKGTLGTFFLLLLPSSFLPLLTSGFLLGMLLPFLPFILREHGSNAIILFAHYVLWLLPFIMLANIYAIKKIIILINKPSDKKLAKFIKNNAKLILLIIATSIIYSNITLSPATRLGYEIVTNYKTYKTEVHEKETVLDSIKPHTPIMLSSNFFTELSDRKNIYYLRYLFTEHHQLSNKTYEAPKNIKLILFSPKDLLVYLSRPDSGPNAGKKFHAILDEFGLKLAVNNYLLFEKDNKNSFKYYQELNNMPEMARETLQTIQDINLIGWSIDNLPTIAIPERPILLKTYWKLNNPLEEHISWVVKIYKNKEEIYSDLKPPSLGIVNTTFWPTDKIIESVFLLPDDFHIKPGLNNLPADITIELTPVTAKGLIILNNIVSAEFHFKDITPIKQGAQFIIPPTKPDK